MAIFGTEAQAAAAAAALADAGIPTGAVTRHARNGTTPAAAGPDGEHGSWAALFGPGRERDAGVFSRSIDAGATVLAVRTPADRVAAVTALLERHDPVEIDGRGARHGAVRAPARPGVRTLPPVIRGAASDDAAGNTARPAGASPAVDGRGTARVRRTAAEEAAPRRGPADPAPRN